jgi:hypothetical protein
MVVFNGDLSNYYAWFIKKRFNLVLNPPLRGAHISFINDREGDMNGKWEEVKKRWHKKKIKVVLDIRPHSSTKSHWWLIIPHDKRDELHSIRAELGLGRPYYGLHMTIGHANEKNIDHSKYIINLIDKGYIRFD